jgi:hypothetical protein
MYELQPDSTVLHPRRHSSWGNSFANMRIPKLFVVGMQNRIVRMVGNFVVD